MSQKSFNSVIFHAQLLIWIYTTIFLTNGQTVSSQFVINKCNTSEISANELQLPYTIFKRANKSDLPQDNDILVRLTTKDLECQGPSEIISLSLNASSPESYFGTSYLKYEKIFFQPTEFCLDNKSETEIQLRICSPRNASLEIKKCCDLDEAFELSRFISQGIVTCRPTGNKSWTPQFYQDRYTKIPQEKQLKMHPRFISYPQVEFCKSGEFSLMTLKNVGQDASPFRILEDGSIIEKIGRRNWESVQMENVCVDGIQNYFDETTGKLSGGFSGDELDTVLLDCRGFSPESEEDSDHYDSQWLYVPVMTIGVIFLCLTIIVILILWRKQTIRGWTLLGYITFLALEFTLIIFSRSIKEHGFSCTATAIGIHFTALSTFSWLTTMNFDVWLNFRTMNPITTHSGNVKLFVAYAIFATSLPISIVTVALVLEDIYGNDPFSEVIVPEYGKTRCNLGQSAEFAYFFGPASVLLGANLIFVLTTLYNVLQNQKILKSKAVKSQILNDKFQFFVKLFIVAGITWIFDIFSWAFTPTNGQTPWYWMIVDFINIFQAVAIFIIFVCNPKTIANLHKQIPCLIDFGDCISSKKPKDPKHTSAKDSRKMSVTLFSVSDNLELK